MDLSGPFLSLDATFWHATQQIAPSRNEKVMGGLELKHPRYHPIQASASKYRRATERLPLLGRQLMHETPHSLTEGYFGLFQGWSRKVVALVPT